MKEKQIFFVGKNSYQEPEKQTDKLYLRQLISEINGIIDSEITEPHLLNSRLKIERDIDDDDPHMRFYMSYSDYDLFPDESIREVGLNVKEKIGTHLDKSFKINPDFYYEISSSGSCTYIRLFIRPIRGTFTCPFCGNRLENSENNFESDAITGEENIVVCSESDHITLFLEDCINQTLNTEEYFKISESLALHVVNPSEREYLMLAFQLSFIAKKEDSSFRSLWLNEKSPKMYVITENGIPAGYVYWNDFNDEKRCARQLFIRDKFRRKGFGTLLFKKSVEIESKNNEFVIESPNKKSIGILLKLGYVNKDDFTGIGCTFCQGL